MPQSEILAVPWLVSSTFGDLDKGVSSARGKIALQLIRWQSPAAWCLPCANTAARDAHYQCK